MKMIFAASMLAIAGIASAGVIQLKPPAGYVTVKPPCQSNISVDVFAIGFDANGNMLGAIKTTGLCGGKYHWTTYSKTDSAVWDIAGNFLTLLPYDCLLYTSPSPRD